MKRFKLLHPGTALFYFTGLTVLIFVFSDIFHRAVAVVCLTALAFFFAGFGKTLRTLRWIVPLGLIMVLMNPLFNKRGATVLFYLWGGSVTLESVVSGVCQALLLVGIVLLFMSFNDVIDQSAFLYLVGRRMPRLAILLNLSLSTSAGLLRRAGDLLDTQRANGIDMPKRKFALELLYAFTASSLEEGMETAEVLKARDYGTQRRTSYRFYTFKIKDAAFMLVMFALLAVSFYFRAGFAAYMLLPIVVEASALTSRVLAEKLHLRRGLQRR